MSVASKPAASPPEAARHDPFTLAIIEEALNAIGDEMFVTTQRTSQTPLVYEVLDFCVGLTDASGDLVAQGNGVTLFLATLTEAAHSVLRKFRPETYRAGDIFITNDPYSGGATHTPDYCCVAPQFGADGRIVAFLANVGHHADVGGRVACTQAVDNQSIFEEGVLIPPVRLCEQGQMVEEVYDIICHNSREPADRRGDIRAHIASLKAGLRRIEEIDSALGTDSMLAYSAALLDYSERRMRALIAELPDGEWSAEDYFDGDGVGSGPLRLRLVMVKRGETLTLDWRDVPPVMKSSRNIPLKALRATCFAVIRSLIDPGMHLNAGVSRVITFLTTRGSSLDPVHPAAVAERATPCQVLADITANCVGQMLPRSAIAAMGAFQGWAFSGIDPRNGRTFANYETMAGGLGATTFSDGMDAVRGWPAGSMNPPIEALEQDMPVVVRRYELLKDSGGNGKFRGGLGMRRDLEIRGHDIRVTSYTMRQVVAPPGMQGGSAGRLARFVLNPDTDKEKVLPVVFTNYPVSYGDWLSCETPGGGGLGNPTARATGMAERDQREGRMSATGNSTGAE